MRTVFSTETFHVRDKFQRWCDAMHEMRVPTQQTRDASDPFEAKLEAARIGQFDAIRTTHGSFRTEATPGLIRLHGQDENVAVFLRLAGVANSSQHGRTSVQRPGDFLILDSSPAAQEYSPGSQMLTLHMPRSRVEAALGPTRVYSGLTIGPGIGSRSLATGFLTELVQLSGSLTLENADRLSMIGIDLIVASVAESLAQDVSRPVGGTVTVQRAKAYVEANLSDPDLGPRELAAAVGVSLRRLQELFHERGRHISDYIWERRLLAAEQRLNDVGRSHLQIGTLAYGCGFSSQAHFSRRFKAKHGMTPGEFRMAALLSTR